MAKLPGYAKLWIPINYSERPAQAKIDAIVLHYTAAGHWRGTYRWFAEYAQAKASAHFIVGRDGELIHCVPVGDKAWHAGNSIMRNDAGTAMYDVNSFSVGFEICNFGLLDRHVDGSYWFDSGASAVQYQGTKYPEPVDATLSYAGQPTYSGPWEPYTRKQFDAVVQACKVLVDSGIHLHRIVGHESICTPIGRKRDPGPLWPWREFYSALGATASELESDALWINHLVDARDKQPRLV
jgi:N-acetylmuramoyl-L-alanine amidase